MKALLTHINFSTYEYQGARKIALSGAFKAEEKTYFAKLTYGKGKTRHHSLSIEGLMNMYLVHNDPKAYHDMYGSIMKD